MPKRRSRSSYSVSPRKSPRKSNRAANTPSSGDKDGKDEEETEPLPPVKFTFVLEEEEEIEMEIGARIALLCLTGEESENENKMPSTSASETEPGPGPVGNRAVQHLVSNGVSSPSKRASPLSPTLLDNVPPQKQAQLPPPVNIPATTPVEPPLPPAPSDPGDVPKIDSDYESSSVASNASPRPPRRRKRRRIISESPNEGETETDDASAAEVQRNEAAPIVSQSSTESSVAQPPSKQASQKTATAITAPPPTSEPPRVDLPEARFRIIEDYDLPDMDPPMGEEYLKYIPQTKEELCRDVIYELDEQDLQWLKLMNRRRANWCGIDIGPVEMTEMELLMDRLEKEHYYDLQNSGLGQPGESDEDAVCCVCLDGESDNSNQIIFCDMCNIPVHQDCYGVPFIPEGSWLCRRCTICPHESVSCIFCPNKDGALKQTVDGRWAHVLCALWIPEVRFANPSLVEPVDDIDDIPPARWRLVCFLCRKKGVGACIQCHLRSCVTAFHPTCAQAAGLSLKVETKESNNVTVAVRMSASCDKHTSQRDRDALTQKWRTITKLFNEKRSDPSDLVKIPAERLTAISELVSFPGKLAFLDRLHAYWRLKSKCRGGAPGIRNPDAFLIPSLKYPHAPEPIERPPIDEDVAKLYAEKMKMLHRGLHKIKEYCSLVKNHCEVQREMIQTKTSVTEIRLRWVDCIYLEVIEKLQEKDKHEFFKYPVTEAEAPDYFTVIKNPMDLTTMREKVMNLEYSNIDELEADFQLILSNCTTYNKKSTIYYKTAERLQEPSLTIFHEARVAIEEREKRLAEEEEQRKKKAARESLSESRLKTELGKDWKYQQDVLFKIVDQLQKRDEYDIFAEPVDTEEVPDYLTVIENPMDFSTMKEKISSNQYSSIEELESDFDLMVNNCLLFNEDGSDYFKQGVKMRKHGKNIFSRAKAKYKGVKESPVKQGRKRIKSETNNNESCNGRVKIKKESLSENESEVGEEEVDDETFMKKLLVQVLEKLKYRDDQEIFAEPVDLEDAPDYLDVIETPMDLSTMQKKLDNSEYATLEDLEKDFNLMIDNCKKFNAPKTVYYGIARLMKQDGDKYFRAARKQLQSRKKF